MSPLLHKTSRGFADLINRDFSVGEHNSILHRLYHLITLSARTSTFGGIVRPICLAIHDDSCSDRRNNASSVQLFLLVLLR